MKWIDFNINSFFGSTSITFSHLSLLFCLLPTFINGILKYGASIIPDELFPIKKEQFFNKLKKSLYSKLLKIGMLP